MTGPGELVGRTAETRAVTAMLAGARNGRGGALLVTGEPGIGKTALLRASTAAFAGRVVRIDGFEAESDLAFAAVQRLVAALHRHVPALSPAHAHALAVAGGRAVGSPPDRFLVGLAVLSLLAAAGDAEPVVCVVDDLHLLDPESRDVLMFVARRLEAESAAVLLAARDGEAVRRVGAGVPVLVLTGLDAEPAVQLLRLSLPGPIDPAAAARVAAATGGNPLALVDLARELSVAELTESALVAEPVPIGTHLEAHYLRRVRVLPGEAQTWLLIAAADSTGDVRLIENAAAALGVPDGADAAEVAGLVSIEERVRFRHPLVKSAAYHAAPGGQRRRVHRALSAGAAALGLVELEAWHASRAARGPDEEVAHRLELVADQAGRRGGSSSRANVLARAATLTPEGPRRGGRVVAAAEAALVSGAAGVAGELLAQVEEDVLTRTDRGRLLALQVSLAMFGGDPAIRRGSAQMLEAAACFRGADDDAEQRALVGAYERLLPVERLSQGVTHLELGQRLAEGAARRDGVTGAVLHGLAAQLLLPYERAVPVMRRALAALEALPAAELLPYGSVGVALSVALWDLAARGRYLDRSVGAARDTGALQSLDSLLWSAALSELRGGTPQRAVECMEQVRELRRAMGYDAEHVVNVAVLAWTGAPREQVEAISDGAAAIGFGGVHSAGMSGLAVRDIADGHYRDAFERLRPLVHAPFLQVTPLDLPDFVEAGVRCGRASEASGAVDQLEGMARVSGTPWVRGHAHLGRALVADDDRAEDHYRAALSALEAAGAPVDLARAHLLHGEWLRRRRRRREAAQQLHRATELFERSGAHLFLARARAEDEATRTEGTARRGSSPTAGLTPQELTVARLAAAGRTNAEIGARMFLSGHTVDYHLRKVFQHLGVTSRRQLADHLGDG
ncbi:AAA family ATPase [Cellulomonas endophytica]|uniref:AAA family ATPase n=1 Tax=Cellulomonas endophytica TaxID=2494735 RepID=UPI001F0BAC8D|nr:LuxR family transcriptional regulator [Cellulomonas endophytica]